MEQCPLIWISKILTNCGVFDTGRVFILDNNPVLPEDENAYVILSTIQKGPFASRLSYKEQENGLTEILTVNMQEEVNIALISKNHQACQKLPLVQQALSSTVSQMEQEQNKFHLSRCYMPKEKIKLPVSGQENRYDLTVKVLYVCEKQQHVDYFTPEIIDPHFNA